MIKKVSFLLLGVNLLLVNCNATRSNDEEKKEQRFNSVFHECTSIDAQHIPMTLIGFNPSELDSVWIRTFEKNTEFKTLTSEFYCFTENTNSSSYYKTYTLYPAHKLMTSDDWQIIINDTLIYSIENIETGFEPVADKKTTLPDNCSIRTYSINGIKVIRGEITITKQIKSQKIPTGATGLICY